MRKTKKITVCGVEYCCKELTAPQVRDTLDEIDKGELLTLDLLFPDRIPAIAVQKSTGKSLQELEELPPSAYDVLLGAVETANPFFAALVTRMITAAEAVTNRKK